jgi:hypothetical protein
MDEAPGAKLKRKESVLVHVYCCEWMSCDVRIYYAASLLHLCVPHVRIRRHSAPGCDLSPSPQIDSPPPRADKASAGTPHARAQQPNAPAWHHR